MPQLMVAVVRPFGLWMSSVRTHALDPCEALDSNVSREVPCSELEADG
jgi:hypothetical protein